MALSGARPGRRPPARPGARGSRRNKERFMSIPAPIRVLIVDDHAMVRRGLAAFLKIIPELQAVGEAGNGREAIELCGQLAPDVVLMDLLMPEMGGAEATRAIRSRWPHIQVIALTSFGEPEMVRDALQAGAVSYLLKNVSGRRPRCGCPVRPCRPSHARAGSGPGTRAVGACRAGRGTRSHRTRARGVGADGQGAEQPRNRRTAGSEPHDGQGTRQQCALQTGCLQPAEAVVLAVQRKLV